jgi:hypothetical protein
MSAEIISHEIIVGNSVAVPEAPFVSVDGGALSQWLAALVHDILSAPQRVASTRPQMAVCFHRNPQRRHAPDKERN